MITDSKDDTDISIGNDTTSNNGNDISIHDDINENVHAKAPAIINNDAKQQRFCESKERLLQELEEFRVDIVQDELVNSNASSDNLCLTSKQC